MNRSLHVFLRWTTSAQCSRPGGAQSSSAGVGRRRRTRGQELGRTSASGKARGNAAGPRVPGGSPPVHCTVKRSGPAPQQACAVTLGAALPPHRCFTPTVPPFIDAQGAAARLRTRRRARRRRSRTSTGTSGSSSVQRTSALPTGATAAPATLTGRRGSRASTRRSPRSALRSCRRPPEREAAPLSCSSLVGSPPALKAASGRAASGRMLAGGMRQHRIAPPAHHLTRHGRQPGSRARAAGVIVSQQDLLAPAGACHSAAVPLRRC